MSCQKEKCIDHEWDKINNCKKKTSESEKCFHHVSKPLFELKPEFKRKPNRKL